MNLNGSLLVAKVAKLKRAPTLNRVPRPRALVVTSLSLWGIALGAGIVGGLAQPAFALCAALAAVVPLRATAPARERGLLVAYAFGAWSLFGLGPVVTIAEPLGGPYGGSPVLFACGLIAAGFRIWALSSGATGAWLRAEAERVSSSILAELSTRCALRSWPRLVRSHGFEPVALQAVGRSMGSIRPPWT